MSKSRTFGPLLLAGAVVLATGAMAAGLTGAEAAKARAAHMKELGGAAKAIGQQLKSGAPDLAVIKLSAAKIAAGAHDLPTWFPAGSGQEADPKSAALPLIWTDAAGFATKAKALDTAAGQLNAVAQGGDAAGVPAAFKAVGAACHGCHETYQAKDKT
jgi:cytochrome c556